MQGWTRCSRSVMSHIPVVTGRPLGWMGQDADLGQPARASISLRRQVPSQASFPSEPPAGPEAPESHLAAARDPSPPGTWGGKRSAQLPAMPPAHVVTLLGRTVTCTPAFPVASVHKGQVPFYLMTEPALTSAPFPGTEFCIWKAGILRVRTHPGVHHGSAAPRRARHRPAKPAPMQPEQEASLCGQFRFE